MSCNELVGELMFADEAFKRIGEPSQLSSINLTIVGESVTTIGMPYATQEQPCFVGIFTYLKKICYFTRKQLHPRDVAKSLMALLILY